jgi:tRNA pseudouridine55 synthase
MDGILLFNKPILWTSHDAVDFIRIRVGQRSVGHAGTLDPMATGLLVLLLGRATKLSSELSGADKDYRGVMTFGLKTDTLDLEGKILQESSCEALSEDRVADVLAGFIGPGSQRPPAFCAVRKNGRKLYEYSRKGIVVEVPERPIHIHQFNLERFAAPDVAFFLSCSKGTYVRTLCESVGARCGCPAVLSALVRTRTGSMCLDQALTAAEVTRLPLEAIEKRLLSHPVAAMAGARHEGSER